MNLVQVKHRLLRNRVVRAIIRPMLPVRSRPDMRRLGSDYGGWWVPTLLLRENATVYSLGIGGDATFDIELMETYGCNVWGYDPTPFSLDYVASRSWPARWQFTPVGVWTESTTLVFEPVHGATSGSASITRAGNAAAGFRARCEPLEDLMSHNGHQHIDILKMDIEGAEGPILDALLASEHRPSVLCVEFDQPEPPWRLVSRIRRILAAGYDLNAVELWNYTFTYRAGGPTIR